MLEKAYSLTDEIVTYTLKGAADRAYVFTIKKCSVRCSTFVIRVLHAAISEKIVVNTPTEPLVVDLQKLRKDSVIVLTMFFFC